MEWAHRGLCSGDARFTDLVHLEDRRQLAETCRACPVLGPCRDYAAPFHWSEVVVAGWVAPKFPTTPPWRDRPKRPYRRRVAAGRS